MVIKDFGKEWRLFDQSNLRDKEKHILFSDYFSIFPWEKLPKDAIGFDLGCGSGRWAKIASGRVGTLHCIDPSSEAIGVAKRNLRDVPNCFFHVADVDNIPLKDNSMDFGYALGVLHHIPDTEKGIKKCVEKLKSGAPLLVYLYYAFDNRPKAFISVWKGSDIVRKVTSKFPYPIKYFFSQVVAIMIYFPIARFAKILEMLGIDVNNMPLSSTYRNMSFYTMRTDALDRFGTRLGKRFTKEEIERMMEVAGLENIGFSEKVPYWCAVGYKKTA